jgi:dipeptidyl aminopeptidase/acylaminoacyl peptidase
MTRLVKVLIPVILFTLIFACQHKKAPTTKTIWPNQTSLVDGLIRRTVLFGNPDRVQPRISPDGRHIAYLAPRDSVMNLWVAPSEKIKEAKVLTDDRHRGIRFYFWAFNNRQLIYVQDQDGDENFRVFSVDIHSGNKIIHTKEKGIRAYLYRVSHKYPNDVMIGLNDRRKDLHDVYRLNLANNTKRLVLKNDQFTGFLFDDDLKLRLAYKPDKEGGMEVLEPLSDGKWKLFTKISYEDVLTTKALTFNLKGDTLYLIDSRGVDKAVLKGINLRTKKEKILAKSNKVDIEYAYFHPLNKTPQAYSLNYLRRKYYLLDRSLKMDLNFLQNPEKGDIQFTSRSLNDEKWLLAYVKDDSPVHYYLYNRNEKKLHFLFTHNSALEKQPLTKMHPVVIKSRDGLNLVSYYSLPKKSDLDGNGIPNKPLPMVLIPHGGPWARDHWGFHSWHQWLANRGYAVLSVNFRGSTGFGKEFLNAASKEWGGKMHNDLIDAVHWTIKKKIARADQVAIMGGSYGGYATLVGMTFTPDTFSCGVNLVGISNLITFLNTIPPYWKPMMEMWANQIGDPRTEEGRQFLKSRSPITYVDRIKRPLLIGQGANDPRVKKSESDQIVSAMQGKNLPVTYVLYPDEGHGFQRPENRLSFYSITEGFLSQCLGGKHQPIGDDFKNSSLQVLAGKSYVPGLQVALKDK